jgi:hypothetical protein
MAADPAGGSPGMSYRLFLVPGQQGDAAGAAVQFRMLTTAGFDTDTAVGGLTAFSLLEVGGLLALPLSALPAIVAGVPVRAGYAYLATLAYRIASYWLPLLAGPSAYLLFRHRYGRPVPRRATPGQADSTA